MPVRGAAVQRASAASCASATCAATGSRRARRRPACRRCPNEAIAITVVDKARGARGRAGRRLPARRAVAGDHRPDDRLRAPSAPLPRNLLPADFYQVRARARPPAAGRHAGADPAVGRRLRGRPARRVGSARSCAPAAAGPRVVALARRAARARRQHAPPRAAAVRVPRVARPAHSWLSREILAFGAFAGAGGGLRRARCRPLLAAAPAGGRLAGSGRCGVALGAVVGGLAGVGCSVMLYPRPARRAGAARAPRSASSATAAAAGPATTLVALLALGRGRAAARSRVLDLARAPAGDRAGAAVKLARRASVLLPPARPAARPLQAHGAAAAGRSRATARRALVLGARWAACSRRCAVAHVADAGDASLARCRRALAARRLVRRRAARALPVLPRGQPRRACPGAVSAPMAKLRRQARPRCCTRTTGRSPASWCARPAASASARCRRGSRPTPPRPMVCGFCSTGCALDVHLRDGEASTSTPTRDYPVNLGMACPKGWEALTPLRRARPRDHAAAARRRRQAAAGRLARRRSTTFVDALQGDPGASTAPSRSRSSAPARSPPRRWRCSARWPSSAWAWSTATATPASAWPPSVVAYKQAFGFDAPPYTYADFEESDVIVLVGSNLCIAHPIMWERVLPQPAPARDHRHRSAQDRDGDGRDAAPRRSRPKSRPGAALRPGPPADRAAAGSTASSSTRTRPASTSSRAFVAGFTPERVAARDRA